VQGKLIEEKLNVSFSTDCLLGGNYGNGVYIVQIRQDEISRQLRVVKAD
jgi:hypothetical protein